MPNTMSNFFSKLKGGSSHKKNKSQSTADSANDPSFSIQPHPAKTNDPADLHGAPGMGGGLKSDPVGQAHHARDPHVPSAEVLSKLEPPASREELQARAAELNR